METSNARATVSVDSTPPTVKQIVESRFAGTPTLIRIAECESHFRQFDKDGSVLRGTANSFDVGVMQINELYHKTEADALGMDIHTLEGNLEFASHLYKREGSKPWNASSKCWAREIASSEDRS